jgi:uncharacterized protein HemY
MHLGSSCTNEMKESEAMTHMENWLKHHPDYSGLPFSDVNTIIIFQTPAEDFEVKKLELWELFNEASKINPHDHNIYVNQGVLCFIDREFEKAVPCFEKAI